MISKDTITRNPHKTKAQSKVALFRVWLLSAGAALCVALALPSTAHEYAYGAIAQEKIYIPDSVYDAPSVGKPTTHTLHIFNLRSKPLTVSAEPSCGCTKVSWDNAVVAPYTYRSITVEVPSSQKDSQYSIAFHTDAPEKPYLFAFLRH